jgi:hypothetical protein
MFRGRDTVERHLASMGIRWERVQNTRAAFALGPNEAAWLRQHPGGHLVRLHRDQANPLAGATATHASEAQTHLLSAHDEVHNHGVGLHGLHWQLDDLMGKLGVQERPPLRGWGRFPCP